LPQLPGSIGNAMSPLDTLRRDVVKPLLLLLLIAPGLAFAEGSFPVSELTVDGIYATKSVDTTFYCILGRNTCILKLPKGAINQDALIDSWLVAHPTAMAVPMSSHNWMFGKSGPAQPRVYLWIEDGADSLNVALVREGRYPAAAMADMVDDYREMADLNDEQLKKERAETPEENKPHRLVSDTDYAEKMQRISIAESQAKREMKGVWADAGLKGRTPPRDHYLIQQFDRHREWFDRIRLLIGENPKLAQVNRSNPKTSDLALSAGIAQKKIDEYLGLLVKLDANEQLVNVQGLGLQCLIVADIIYGAFDNGVIKGYVYGPTHREPVFQDLENWPSDAADVMTAYRPVADGWYLFELHH
jgi:hypothetical protein